MTGHSEVSQSHFGEVAAAVGFQNCVIYLDLRVDCMDVVGHVLG